MNTKVENKVIILSDTLKESFGDNMNLARIKFFGLFISALCKVQTVCFEKLACCFDTNVRVDSSLNRQNAPELQIIVSFNKPANAQTLYEERWQIGSAFTALKTSGFNIEDTHLTDIERISKLMALVLIAFAWIYKAGIYLDGCVLLKSKTMEEELKACSNMVSTTMQTCFLAMIQINLTNVVNFCHVLN
jgi:hypothetical protein